jgi:TolB protein
MKYVLALGLAVLIGAGALLAGCGGAAGTPAAGPGVAPLGWGVGKIVFINSGAVPSGVCWMKASGTGLSWVDKNGHDYAPVWSPDGTKVAFERMNLGTVSTEDLWVVNSTGSGLKQLTKNTSAMDACPHWSPDGTKLVFCRESITTKGITLHLYVMPASGGTAAEIGTGTAVEYHPCYSPDGKSLVCAYHASGGSKYQLATMKTDGTGLKILTTPPASSMAGDNQPEWSPNGKYIAFDRGDSSGGIGDIYRVPATGGTAQQLTHYTGTERFCEPAWSPDSAQIVYSCRPTSSTSQLWMMNTNGTGPKLFSGGTTYKSTPYWH